MNSSLIAQPEKDHNLTRLKKILRRVLLAPLVLVLLFEEWGWEPLARGFAAVGRLPFWASLEQWILRLPPWAALLAFAVPALALVPVKLLALYLLGQGHVVSGLGLVIAAKISGTALAARLFQLTQPALIKLAWFARLYTPWKIWKDRVLAQARSSRLWLQMKQLKLRMRALASRLWRRIKHLFTHD